MKTGNQKKVKFTKSQLNEMITGIVSNFMTTQGDNKMTPEAQMFYYRGLPPNDLFESVKGIVESLQGMGIELPESKDLIINKIILDIRKLVIHPM